jgi:hypothetical protein
MRNPQLTEWRDQALSDKDDWIKAVALALAAARCLEIETDLTAGPWPFLADLLVAAEGQSDEDALARLEAFEQSFQQQPPLALIAADADQIQAYVFESAKIPEVRGASALVEWLNLKGLREVLRRFGLPREVLIYQGGGGAMLVTPAVIAGRVRQEIEKQFVTTTCVATITTVSRDVSLLELLQRERFQKVRTMLMHNLQVAKLQREAPVHFEWLPMARRCQACEVRPASGVYTKSADRPLLCEGCKTKRERGRVQRLPLRFHNYLQEQFKKGRFPSYLEGVQRAEEKELPPWRVINRVDRAEDLHELSPDRYVGVIAADGDGVGGILTQLNSLAEFAHFSQNLYGLSNTCVFESLAAHLRVGKRSENSRPEKKPWFHPFELVALGGDDIFLIVPANKALPVALSISDYWRKHAPDIIPESRRSEKEELQPPSLSLGLLICPSTFPLYFMHNLAEQLLQKAKTERSRLKAPEGFLDFLILKASGVPRVEAGQIQKELYWYQEQGSWGENSLQCTLPARVFDFRLIPSFC